MPRKLFQCDPLVPYHLVARSNNREWFDLPIDRVWSIFSDYLHFTHHAFGVQIHSFVLMNNHFHLIATFPNGNLSDAMEYLQRETSRAIGRDSRRINHVYGTRIFRSRLGSFRYFEAAYKYVYRNPCDAGLCDVPSEYAYSTLIGLLGQTRLLIPTVEDTLLFQDMDGTIKWLNQVPELQNREFVKRALRRAEFNFPRLPNRFRNPLEYTRY